MVGFGQRGQAGLPASPEHCRRITVSLQPYRDKRTALADAVSLVTDGAIVALGGGLSARLPMAMVRELVRQGRRDLHLVGSAHSIDVVATALYAGLTVADLAALDLSYAPPFAPVYDPVIAAAQQAGWSASASAARPASRPAPSTVGGSP